jgi:hypothetical protein
MRMGMHGEEVRRPSHTGSPAMQHRPQQDEGADGADALVPEAPVSMRDDQELDEGYGAHKAQAAHRKGWP